MICVLHILLLLLIRLQNKNLITYVNQKTGDFCNIHTKIGFLFFQYLGCPKIYFTSLCKDLNVKMVGYGKIMTKHM